MPHIDINSPEHNWTLPLTDIKHNSTVSVYLLGGLGNQLFQAASSYGIALSRGANWCILNLDESLLSRSVDFNVQPTSCESDDVDMVGENGLFLEFQEWMMYGDRNIRVGMYLQSYKYFALSGIPFELKTLDFGKIWVAERKIEVGIHVRRTDQLTTTHGGKDPGIGYFAVALKKIQDFLGTEIKAVVCTDDPEWVRAQSLFDGMYIRTTADKAEEDMAILAACKHIILSIGTFGWWSAYFHSQDGRVYYYETPFIRKLNYSEHFLPKWISISDRDINALPQSQSQDNIASKHLCDLTVVTSYFKIPSKHSHNEYLEWMQNLLSLDTCLLVFTDNPTLILSFRSLEFMDNTRVINTDLHSTAMENLYNFSQSFWNKQYEMDPEKQIHQGPPLYWVWGLKTHFVKTAIDLNYFNTEFYAWFDIGCMRSGQFNGRGLFTVPDQVRNGQGVFFSVVEQFQKEDLTLTPGSHNRCITSVKTFPPRISAAIFLGAKNDMLRFHASYVRKLYEEAIDNQFIGKDQTLMIMICIEVPALCSLINSQPNNGDVWFGILPFLLEEEVSRMPYYQLQPLLEHGCEKGIEGYFV